MIKDQEIVEDDHCDDGEDDKVDTLVHHRKGQRWHETPGVHSVMQTVKPAGGVREAFKNVLAEFVR